MKKTFFRLYNFLNRNEKNKLKFIFFITSLSFILEFVSISSIPIFFGLVTEKQIIIENFSKFLLFFGIEMILSKENIILIGIIVVMIFLIKNLLLFYLLIYENKFYEHVKNRLSEKLYSDFIFSDYERLLNFNPSNISRTIVSSVNDAFLYIQSLVGLYKELLAILAIFLLILLVNPLTVIFIFLLFSVVLFGYYKFLKPFLHNAGRENQFLLSKIIKVLNETFGSLKELRILKKEKDIKDNFLIDIYTYNRNFLYFNIIQRLPKIFLEIIFLVALMLMTLYFFRKNQDFVTLMPEIILYTIVSLRFIPAFNSLSSSFTYLKIGEASINTIFDDLKRLTYKSENEKSKKLNVILKSSKQKFLSIENLSYKYPGKKDFTLKDISINLDKGNTVVITGSTGSGKTTLMNLMLGFLKPSEGNIFYYGENIYSLSRIWSNHISYVSQSCYLMDTSIKNNITFNFAQEKIDSEKLEKAINLSNLDKFVDSLPQRANTQVGNDGIKISGGERQRIAIARAIYKNSDIIFMDEFSSALDAETEELIFKNLSKEFKQKTLITISHRENIIKNSDIILNMFKGNLEKKSN